MESIMHILHLIVENTASIAGTALELFGIVILIYKGFTSFMQWVGKSEESSISLAEGIAMALEFLMAGEVLHTILADDVNDLVILGALVVLRGIMTLEIHWELKNEKAELENRKLREKAGE